jgi:hypothetical protein
MYEYFKNGDSAGDQNALRDALTKRFGDKIANDVIEQIELIKSSGKTPDYMPVKACSEMMELFRGEAQVIARKLKQDHGQWDDEGANIAHLEKRKLEMEFRHVFRLYWTSMKLFYPLYRRAMADCREKSAFPRRKPASVPAETSSVAMAA